MRIAERRRWSVPSLRSIRPRRIPIFSAVWCIVSRMFSRSSATAATYYQYFSLSLSLTSLLPSAKGVEWITNPSVVVTLFSVSLTLLSLIRDHHVFICFRLRWGWTADGQVPNKITVKQRDGMRMRLKARHGLDVCQRFSLSPADCTHACCLLYCFEILSLSICFYCSQPLETRSIWLKWMLVFHFFPRCVSTSS